MNSIILQFAVAAFFMLSYYVREVNGFVTWHLGIKLDLLVLTAFI
jgi:hypothetical protein